jgi:hypothetical protein
VGVEEVHALATIAAHKTQTRAAILIIASAIQIMLAPADTSRQSSIRGKRGKFRRYMSQAEDSDARRWSTLCVARTERVWGTKCRHTNYA